MKHLRTACVALAFVATTVSGSAQTSLPPGQSTTSYRTIIPQPAPVMRESIVNLSAGSDVGPGAAQRLAQNNVFVDGALAVPGAPANSDTVPAKFSAKNAADDELITVAYTFKMLTDEQRRAIYEALKDQPASAFNADVGTELPPAIELRPVPDEVAARVPQTRGYRYVVANDRVLLVGTSRIVVGVFADVPVSEGFGEAQAAPVDAITTAVAPPATIGATEPPQQPVAASKKSQKTARSQNRRYAWGQQHAHYGRGRGYGHERPSSSW